MKRWALLLATICALLQLGDTAASAAWVIPPRASVTAQALVDRYLPVARAAWPGSPCEGQERVTVDDDDEFTRVVSSHPDAYPGDVGAMAFGAGVTDPSSPDYCRVGLAAATAHDPFRFCVILTHELGHLAGLAHSDVTGSVMSATWPAYRPCIPSRSDGLDLLLRLGLPRPDAWTFSCVVVRGGALHCTASAPFVKHVRYLLVRSDLRVVLPRARFSRPG